MAGPEHSALSALANIEERVRRYFKAAGRIGIGFQPIITPVALVADLTQAGSSTSRGRRFAYMGSPLSWGADGGAAIEATDDIVIDWISVQMIGAGRVIAYIAPVSSNALWTFPVTFVGTPFLDRNAGAEMAPVKTQLNAVQVFPNGGTSFWHVPQGGSNPNIFPGQIALNAGDRIQFFLFGTGTVAYIGFGGHTY